MLHPSVPPHTQMEHAPPSDRPFLCRLSYRRWILFNQAPAFILTSPTLFNQLLLCLCTILTPQLISSHFFLRPCCLPSVHLVCPRTASALSPSKNPYTAPTCPPFLQPVRRAIYSILEAPLAKRASAKNYPHPRRTARCDVAHDPTGGTTTSHDIVSRSMQRFLHAIHPCRLRLPREPSKLV